MKQLILIRGLPGSGKSTLARNIKYEMGGWCSVNHLEADMFFLDRNGVYQFNPKMIKDAHAWCQNNTIKALNDFDDSVVIVSNTFTTKWEMEAYFKIARAFGIVPIVYLAQNQFQNVHGVPSEVIEKMKARFEYDISDLFKEYA